MSTTSHDEFQTMAMALRDEAVRLRLIPPIMRDNPHVPGADRTIRQTPVGQWLLRVNRWRDPYDVAHDLIEGILKANDLSGDEAEPFKAALWMAAGLSVDA